MNIESYEIPAEDRGAFVKVMAFLAAADGEVSLEEKQALDNLIFRWQLDTQEVEDVYSVMNGGGKLDKILSQLVNIKTAFLLIQELVTLASLDGNYSDLEKKAVREIANQLNVSDKRLGDIEQWVEEGMTWRQKGLELLKAEEV